MANALASIWRRIIVGEGKSWVVFRHGTCVIVSDGAGDLTARALGIMRDWGPVHVGGAAGDFSVITLADEPGWVVTCHHPDILTYASPDDLPPDPSEVRLASLAGTAARTAMPMRPGQPALHDYEYECNGTANLFMLFARRIAKRYNYHISVFHLLLAHSIVD